MKLFADKEYEPAVLALADGSIFKGHAFGCMASSERPVLGEVVFNTALYGYQEITTDPSYAGQIMCFTNPQVGNVGSNSLDVESQKVFVEGVIIRNLPEIVSNFRAQQSFAEYLSAAGKMGIAGIDTRQLVQHIRDRGAQMGAMASGTDINPDDLVDQARSAGSMLGKDYVTHVTCQQPYQWTSGLWTLKDNDYQKFSAAEMVDRPLVIVIDCGVKHNILRNLVAAGFKVQVVPAFYTAEQILSFKPQALFISNGPGDPAVHTNIVNTIQVFLGHLPIFGICLGHQLLALSVGAKTYKLKFGHRGGNHPVLEKSTGVIEITTQNHGFAVDEASIPKGAAVSHINLNDNTIEGLQIEDLQAFSVQYHPEASPGPHDSAYLFNRFYKTLNVKTYQKQQELCQNEQI